MTKRGQLEQLELLVLQPATYCNAVCSYCYLPDRDAKILMGLDVVNDVADKILSQLDRDATPTIVWHSGEPLTAPISWYESAYSVLLSKAPRNTKFAIQSNGIAINQRWIQFFKTTNTSVGLSIDGPQMYHDARRKSRSGAGTWTFAVRALKLLQDAQLPPSVITVLSPQLLKVPALYYQFLRKHGITRIGFNVDEIEGHNHVSALSATSKDEVSGFILQILESAYLDRYPLQIRDVERVSKSIICREDVPNEQVIPWRVIAIDVTGRITTFSPELLAQRDATGRVFSFGSIADDAFPSPQMLDFYSATSDAIEAGRNKCKQLCSYYGFCGGGAPVNKFAELGSFDVSETSYCRLTIQASVDALNIFLNNKIQSKEGS